jgi:CheY-like chemotaxis protein
MTQILILEQRPERIAEFRRLLEPKYTLVFVDSVMKAMQAAKLGRFVLFISALHLVDDYSDDSIFDFLRAVKADPRISSVPFFLCCIGPSPLTLSMADALKITARALGADYFELVSADALSAMPALVMRAVETGKKRGKGNFQGR